LVLHEDGFDSDLLEVLVLAALTELVDRFLALAEVDEHAPAGLLNALLPDVGQQFGRVVGGEAA